MYTSHKSALSTDKYNDFIDANRIEDAEDRLNSMKKLVGHKRRNENRQKQNTKITGKMVINNNKSVIQTVKLYTV